MSDEQIKEAAKIYSGKQDEREVFETIAKWVRDRMMTENTRLIEALQDILDEQNGPPLMRREREWQAAYDKGRDLLVELTGNPADLDGL